MTTKSARAPRAKPVYGPAWGALIKRKPGGRRPHGIERDLRSGALRVNAEGATLH